MQKMTKIAVTLIMFQLIGCTQPIVKEINALKQTHAKEIEYLESRIDEIVWDAWSPVVITTIVALCICSCVACHLDKKFADYDKRLNGLEKMYTGEESEEEVKEEVKTAKA